MFAMKQWKNAALSDRRQSRTLINIFLKCKDQGCFHKQVNFLLALKTCHFQVSIFEVSTFVYRINKSHFLSLCFYRISVMNRLNDNYFASK